MITAKIDPIRRDLDVAINSWLGPQARADMLVDAARPILADVDAQNDAAVDGHVPHETFVDGVKTESIDRVRADGLIVRTYDVMPLALGYIGELLWKHSPYKTGRYQKSHRLLADGEEVAVVRPGWIVPTLPRGVRELMFTPIVDYARRLERGWSKQAPDGVYQVVAVMAKAPFGKFAKIRFDYRPLVGVQESGIERKARPGTPRDLRQPVIIINPS